MILLIKNLHYNNRLLIWNNNFINNLSKIYLININILLRILLNLFLLLILYNVIVQIY
jgi:hypothetical protein